jgi:WD40 repeat protein
MVLADDTRLVSCHRETFDIYVRNILNGHTLYVMSGHARNVYSMTLVPLYDHLLITASGDGTVKVWDIHKGGAIVD